jgi:ribosomal protein L11 methyltransferase
MTGDWVEAKVMADGEAAEAIAEALRPFAHQEGVVLEQLGDMTNLEPDALEPVVAVKIYFPADDQAEAVQQRIREALHFMSMMYPIAPPTFQVLAETDWANAWKKHYEPFRVGSRLWIQPSWQQAKPATGTDVVLTLDPGMAFGTGLHPTTQMCLQALEDLVTPGIDVLDVGTGSGILAIAAAKLGARRVLGVDNDGQAVAAASANVTLNGVADVVDIRSGTLSGISERPWDLVVVNILAPVIQKLLHQYGLMSYVAPGGALVLSGIVDEQLSEVQEAVEAQGGAISKTLAIRDWVALIGRHA